MLEFDGGVSDTHVLRGGTDHDAWSGYGPQYRPPPASQPQARIPSGRPSNVYDIGYYAKDVRRNQDPLAFPVERSFHESTRALLEGPAIIDAPKTGGPGNKVRLPSFFTCQASARHTVIIYRCDGAKAGKA